MSKQRKAEAVLNEPYENQIVKQRTLFQETWMRFRRSKTAMFGLCFLLVLVVISVGTLVIDLVSNSGVYDAYVVAQDPVNRLQGPSGAHVLGMDELGRDILMRILWGARYSLFMSLLLSSFAEGGVTNISSESGYLPCMLRAPWISISRITSFPFSSSLST